MSNTKKILSIILLTLLILSTVFTLCKKVGLCAASSDSPLAFTGFPYIVGNGIATSGYFSSSFINTCVDDAITRYGSSSGFIYAYQTGNTTDGGSLWVCFTPTSTISMPSDGTTLNTSITFTKIYGYTLNGYSSENSNRSIPFQPYRVFETLNGTKCYIRNTYIVNYPVYVKNPDLFLFSGTSTQVFGFFQGIDSPGFNPDFLDSYLDLVDDGQFNNSVGDLNGYTVQNPTNLEEWLELINGNMIAFFKRSIAGFKTINDNIVSGFNWLSDKIEEFNEKASDRLEGFLTTTISGILSLFDDVKDNTDDIKDDIHGHYQWQQGYFTVSGSSNSTFWDYFDDHLTEILEDFTENIWGHLPSTIKDSFRFFKAFYDFGVVNGEFSISTFFEKIFSFDIDDVEDAWEDEWEESDVYTLINHFKSMHNSILSIIDVEPADSLSFTIDMYPITIPNLNGGNDVVYLFGRSLTLDFSWYKSALFGGRTIQDIVLSVLLPFLYVGFIFSLVFKSPAIISGVSGFVSNVKEISSRGDVVSTMVQTKKINPSTRIVFSRRL